MSSPPFDGLMTAAAAILLEGAKNDENCSMNATEHSKSFGVIPLQYVVSIAEPVILKRGLSLSIVSLMVCRVRGYRYLVHARFMLPSESGELHSLSKVISDVR